MEVSYKIASPFPPASDGVSPGVLLASHATLRVRFCIYDDLIWANTKNPAGSKSVREVSYQFLCVGPQATVAGCFHIRVYAIQRCGNFLSFRGHTFFSCGRKTGRYWPWRKGRIDVVLGGCFLSRRLLTIPFPFDEPKTKPIIALLS